MKKKIVFYFLFCGINGFSQSDSIKIQPKYAYKGEQTPLEVFINGNLHYAKDFKEDSIQHYPLIAEYFRTGKDTFFAINYANDEVISFGHVISSQPLLHRKHLTILQQTPPYGAIEYAWGFSFDYKIGEWQEINHETRHVWIGMYTNGKRIGRWISVPFFNPPKGTPIIDWGTY